MTGDRRLTLAVVSTGTAMLLLDVTVVNVALPVIRDDLDASFAELQWVIDAYARSESGARSPAQRSPSARSSAACSSTAPAGAGCSSSTCLSARFCCGLR